MLLVNERLLSDAVAESQGVVLEAYAYSLSLFMINSVSTQNSSAQIANAAVATACTELLKAGLSP
jgi:hypothetical protein